MKPVLVVNPRSDARFAQTVNDLMAQDDLSAEQLESRLHETYPHALVRRRLLSGEMAETWYVYREGTWIPNDAETPQPISKPQLMTWSTTPDASKPSKS